MIVDESEKERERARAQKRICLTAILSDLLICRFPVGKMVVMARNKNICTRTSCVRACVSSASITMTTETMT